jgi:hypothetical protein
MLISILRFIPHRFLGASSGTTSVHIVAHVNPVDRQLSYTLLALCDLLSYIIITRFLYYLPSLPYVFVAKFSFSKYLLLYAESTGPGGRAV